MQNPCRRADLHGVNFSDGEVGGGGVFDEGRSVVEGWGGKGRGGVFEERNVVTKEGRKEKGGVRFLRTGMLREGWAVSPCGCGGRQLWKM